MSTQLGYHHPQQAVAVPNNATPTEGATFEGTALAATIGAAVGATATQVVCYLGNFRFSANPKVDAAVTVGAAVFGGATGALSYRMSANRAYQAAQHAMRMSGANPGERVLSFRAQGRLGRRGNFDLEAPVEGITQVVRTLQGVSNPTTPNAVNKYFEAVAEHAADMAGDEFTQRMPPPQYYVGMQQPTPQQPPPQYYAPWCPPPVPPQQPYFYPPPPQYTSPPPHAAPPPKNGR